MGICLPLFFFIIISDCLEQLMRIVGKRGGMPALFLSFPSIPVAIHALSNVLLYREEWINMLIVIDHGNKNIKTKHRTFTAGLLASEYPAYGGETVKFACQYYTLTDRRGGKENILPANIIFTRLNFTQNPGQPNLKASLHNLLLCKTIFTGGVSL